MKDFAAGKVGRMKLHVVLAFALLLAASGCGNVDSASSPGGAGGEATTSQGGTTVSGLGGTGGGTASTTAGGTGGAECVVPGASPCGPQDPFGYPDPLASYDPANAFGGYLNPIPGTDEVGLGAGAARLGPWAGDRDFVAFSVVLAAALPDPLRFAAWSEPQCGLPSDLPHDHAQDAALADVQQQDADGAVRVTVAAQIHVPAGESLYLALVTTEALVGLRVVEPDGATAPRALWWGIVDGDCDGEIDPVLGWAYLDSPTAPGVGDYHYDLAFSVQ